MELELEILMLSLPVCYHAHFRNDILNLGLQSWLASPVSLCVFSRKGALILLRLYFCKSVHNLLRHRRNKVPQTSAVLQISLPKTLYSLEFGLLGIQSHSENRKDSKRDYWLILPCKLEGMAQGQF